jgi:response regulator RpfG family c-di-GMP phosphodiesterase
MTSDRPYRKALSFEAALEEIRSCSGTQFDPNVTEAFLRMPMASWIAIHDAVNRSHPIQDCLNLLCPISDISR